MNPINSKTTSSPFKMGIPFKWNSLVSFGCIKFSNITAVLYPGYLRSPIIHRYFELEEPEEPGYEDPGFTDLDN